MCVLLRYLFTSQFAPSRFFINFLFGGCFFIRGDFINYLFEILITLFTFFLGKFYLSLNKKIQAERLRSQAISESLKALLRHQLVDDYNKYDERGVCPIYAKESVDKLFQCYKSLGGNGTVDVLVEKLMEMEEHT